MHTHPRTLWIARLVTALGLLVLAAITGCVGTGSDRRLPTPTELAAMDDAEWSGYMTRVEAWAAAAGYSAVEAGADANDIIAFSTALAAVTDTSGDWLAALAEQAGLDAPIARLLVLEGQALLDARGGLPGGPRAVEWLNGVAVAIVGGAASADSARRREQ